MKGELENESNNGYHVAVVGATGAVGEQMIQTLVEREFPNWKINVTYLLLVQQVRKLNLKVKNIQSRKQS